MKKWLMILFVLVMCFTFCACGENSNNDAEVTPALEKEEVVDEAHEEVGNGITAQDAFNKAINLTGGDLVLNYDSMFYSYKGARLMVNDYSMIGGKLVVDQSAIYNAVASRLAQLCTNDGYLFKISNNSDEADEEFFNMLLGTGKPSSFEAFQTIMRKLGSYIVYGSSEREIFKALESSSNVKGKFDYDARTYSFEIRDIRKTAEDLSISEEMLGYLLAATTVYAVEFDRDFKWEKNSVEVTFSVTMADNTPPIKSFDVDNPTIVAENKFDMACGDFLAGIGDICRANSPDLATLQNTSEEHMGWIYSVYNKTTPVAKVAFYDSELANNKQNINMKSKFDTVSTYYEYSGEEDWYTGACFSMISIIMQCDPRLSAKEAQNICYDIMDSMKASQTYQREMDGIKIDVIMDSGSSFLFIVGVS